MSEETQQQVVDLLREIREGQREIIGLLSAQRVAAEEHIKKSRESVTESVGLQRLALTRQRTVTLIAVQGFLPCIAAIAYLVMRYF